MSVIINGTDGVQFNDSSLQGAAASPFGLKNRIINGDMRIDQRNAGASLTNNTGVQFPVDRMLVYGNGVASKFTMQQNQGSVTPPAGFTNYLGFTSSAATTVGSADIYEFLHRIEGFNTADLTWGTADAKTVTLSFWIRSSLTGSFGGAVRNSAGNRSYPFAYTINAANTWEQKTITIPGDTTGTWLTNNGIGVEIVWSLGIGSTSSGTAGSWSGSNFYSATGTTSLVSTNGATLYITGIQLEVGSTATPFERRLYGQELALCQRYFWKPNNAFLMQGITSNRVATNIFYPAQMRANPTLSLSTTTPYWESLPYNTVGSITSGAAEGSKLTSMGGLMSFVGTFGTTPVQSYPGLFGTGTEITFSAEL